MRACQFRSKAGRRLLCVTASLMSSCPTYYMTFWLRCASALHNCAVLVPRNPCIHKHRERLKLNPFESRWGYSYHLDSGKMWVLHRLGSGDSSVVRAPDSCSKCRGFEFPQERRENCLFRGQLSVLILISASASPLCHRSGT